MTKWQFTNYKGEQVTWYSGDVIEKIKEITKKYDANAGDTIIANPIQDCYDIYCLINEIDEVKDDNP